MRHFQDKAIAALLESAPDGILLVDEQGSIVVLNEAAEQLFGYSREDLVGQKVELLVPSRFRERHAADRAGYLEVPRRRPMGIGFELCGLRKDGSEFPVEISLSPMPWQERTLVVTIVRDVTQQKLVEEERLRLARAEAVEEIVSGLEAIVWESARLDRSSLTFLGGREDALLGYPREDWLKEDFWLSVVHAEDRSVALAFADAAGEQETFELEYRLIAANGDVRHVRDIVSVSRAPDGAPMRARGVIVDVTDRRALESKLALAQKLEAVGQLAGGIAHDFNNLLTIASGHARRLVRREELSAARAELSQIITATDRAAELTRQLLTFARRGEGEVVPLDANETLRTLQPMLRRLLDEDIAFDVTLGERVPRILGDATNLEQIVMNLVLNARDAMPNGGLLSVATSTVEVTPQQAAERKVRPGAYLVLSVTDTGTGIEPEARAHLFEPFYTTKEGHGTGMGLATVYGLVQQAGGHIEVESQPGAGTTFAVGLPAAETGEATPEPSAFVQPPTVLLVEDEPALRELAAMILEGEGYLVIQASDGGDAVNVAERYRGPIDLLLTDVVMPKMSGPELAQRLSGLRPGLEVLYMSGYNDSRLLARGLEEQSVNLLTKPFTPDELAEQVARLTSHSGA
jgi:PAS domain S-box-containing protein